MLSKFQSTQENSNPKDEQKSRQVAKKRTLKSLSKSPLKTTSISKEKAFTEDIEGLSYSQIMKNRELQQNQLPSTDTRNINYWIELQESMFDFFEALFFFQSTGKRVSFYLSSL